MVVTTRNSKAVRGAVAAAAGYALAALALAAAREQLDPLREAANDLTIEAGVVEASLRRSLVALSKELVRERRHREARLREPSRAEGGRALRGPAREP